MQNGSPPATPVPTVRRLAPDDAADLAELVARVRADRGIAPVDEGRLDRAVAGPTGGYVAALARHPASGELTGYAHALRDGDTWDMEAAVLPAGRSSAPAPDAESLLRAVLTAIRDDPDHAGAHPRLWVYGAGDADDRLAHRLGLSPARELRQLRRPLPVEPEVVAREPRAATRPFVVGQDEDAWLTLNRRAFAWHPEQGRLTARDLRDRLREPWFDPDGFLLHETDGRPVAFCWTKVHRDTRPPLGEIYVIGVDPEWHGRGLGAALVLAGLDHLTRAGLTTAMLYVEADNAPALRLYERLGFAVHHVDRAYTSR